MVLHTWYTVVYNWLLCAQEPRTFVWLPLLQYSLYWGHPQTHGISTACLCVWRWLFPLRRPVRLASLYRLRASLRFHAFVFCFRLTHLVSTVVCTAPTALGPGSRKRYRSADGFVVLVLKKVLWKDKRIVLLLAFLNGRRLYEKVVTGWLCLVSWDGPALSLSLN